MNKKLNKKLTLGALSVAALLNLTGFSKNSPKVINAETIVSDEVFIPIEEQEDKVSFRLESSIYSDTFLEMVISAEEGAIEVTDDFYEKVNKDISNCDRKIDALVVDGLSDQVDFSKLNIDYDNIDRLYFHDCSDSFKSILKKFKKEVRYVSFVEQKKNSNSFKTFLNSLIEEDVSVETLNISSRKNNGKEGISKEEFQLLSKVKVFILYIYTDGFYKPVDLDLTLNEKIHSFSLDAYNKYDKANQIVNGELGNIKIQSSNPELSISFGHSDITENTHFKLSDAAWVDFDLLNCKSIKPFENLKNVSYLSFQEDNGPGPEANNDGCIKYGVNSVHLYDAFSTEEVEMYRNYKTFLKDLKTYYNLAKLKEKLDVAPNEYYDYYSKASIGDYVNLKSNNTPIYDYNGNKRTSLFKTSILRLISSIVLEKDGVEVTVYNMEDYSKYVNKSGFKIKGFNLINEYSLNDDNTLAIEGFVKENDIELVRTPFK